MKNKKIKIITSIILALALTLSLSITSVFAQAQANEEGSKDGVAFADPIGNVFAGNDDSVNAKTIAKDYYWAGYKGDISNMKIGYDALMAGYELNLSDIEMKGSLRGACSSLILSNVKVGHNITVAGDNLVLLGNTKAQGLYAAGRTLSLDGTYDFMAASGETVNLNGTVKGDVKIDANKVVIGDNAKVTGTLYIEAKNKPEIPSSAQINAMEFTKSASNVQEKPVHKAFGFSIYMFFVTLVLGLFFCLVMKKALNQSGQMIVERPVAMSVTGLVSFIAFPPACIILMITVIGIPLGLILGALYAIILCTAVAFSGASVGRIVFPTMNQWLSSLIGVVVLAILAQIPYLGVLIVLASMFYALGYFIQVVYAQLKGKSHEAPKAPNGPEGGVPSATNDAKYEYVHVE